MILVMLIRLTTRIKVMMTMELMKLTSSLVWLDSIRLTRHWNLIFIKKVNLSLRSMNCLTLKARV